MGERDAVQMRLLRGSFVPDAEGWKHRNEEPDLSIFSRGTAIPLINTLEMSCSRKCKGEGTGRCGL